MCNIIDPIEGPRAGQTFAVTVTGVPTLSWNWSISGDLGSGNGTSESSTAQVNIPISSRASGRMLTLGLTGAEGSDLREWQVVALEVLSTT